MSAPAVIPSGVAGRLFLRPVFPGRPATQLGIPPIGDVLALRQTLMERTFHVYILAGNSGVLYTGMTNNLLRRIAEHKLRQVPGFTQIYNATKLVWFEAHGRATSAIAREKEIKAWGRAEWVALIEATNPHWKDLSEELP